jgi:hypothetical protein
MKIRNGFVSNSSSSSFCIIGVTGQWAERLADAEGKQYREPEPIKKEVPGCEHKAKKGKFCPICGASSTKTIEVMPENYKQDFFSHGYDSGKEVTFYSNYNYPEYAGVDAEPLLEEFSIKSARKYFQTMVTDKLGVDIPLDVIGFYYGECGDG